MMATSEQQSAQSIRNNLVLIKDMRPMLKNFECEVIVLQKESEPTTTRDGDVIYRYIVADKSGAIILSVWGLPGQYIKGGDILHIIGGTCKVRKGQLSLSAIRSSKVRRIGQDTFQFVEKPNLSEVDYSVPSQNWSNNSNNNNNYTNNNNNNNNNNARIGQQEQDQQQGQSQQQGQQNSSRPHNRSHPYRGGRPPRGGGGVGGRGNGPNKPRYHRDLDNVM